MTESADQANFRRGGAFDISATPELVGAPVALVSLARAAWYARHDVRVSGTCVETNSVSSNERGAAPACEPDAPDGVDAPDGAEAPDGAFARTKTV